MSANGGPDERGRCLERAGHNVMNLDPEDVALDLQTDIPPRAFDPHVVEAEAAAARGGVREPDLQELATSVYGPAQYLALTRGRAAELAMAAALGKDRPVVVTPGMWRTTERAFAMRGGTIENAPRAPGSTSDLDLDWLDARMARGAVDFVVLEPSNGQLAGFPLSLANARAVADRCKAHGAKLLVDATRVLANFAAVGPSPLAATRELLALADVFFVSCAKECLVPHGALLGVRSHEQQKAAFVQAFLGGTILEPLSSRAALAAGLERLLGTDAEPIRERRRHLLRLASALRDRGVPVVEPVGAHAVYVELDALLHGKPKFAAHAFEGLLYRVAGVRASTGHSAALGKSLLRLILPVGRYGEAEVDAVARGVTDTLARAAELPTLTPVEPPPLFEIFTRYAAR